MSANTTNAMALPIEAMEFEVEVHGEHDGEAQPGRDTAAEASTHHRRELADRRELLAQPRRGVQAGVGRARGGEQVSSALNQ
jgi:hypothetical protein